MLQKYKKFFLYIVLLSNISTHLFAAQKHTVDPVWVAKALKLQREIDLDTPINEATFLGTHNSYNSKAYQNPVRYVDPNQNISIYDQLEAGIRSLELDVHWTLNQKFREDILLCHGLKNHVGCSIFDRKLAEGLREIRDWLKAHPKEVVLLYIERHLNGHEDKLAAQLDQYLKKYIYMPTTIARGKSHCCIALPGNLTKAEVLRTGKQLILVTKHCDTHDKKSSSAKPYAYDYIFASIGTIANRSFSFIDGSISDSLAYPNCGKFTTFKDDVDHTSLWRILEDRTVLSNRPLKKRIVDKVMKNLLQCNINWPAVDMLMKNDSRLIAAIWSWAPNHPSDDNNKEPKCAVYTNEGMIDMNCESTTPGYLCKDQKTAKFKVISRSGNWKEGEAMCQTEGPTWHFSVPINGYQAQLTKEAMQDYSLREIWLNYATNTDHNWIAHLLKPQNN